MGVAVTVAIMLLFIGQFEMAYAHQPRPLVYIVDSGFTPSPSDKEGRYDTSRSYNFINPGQSIPRSDHGTAMGALITSSRSTCTHRPPLDNVILSCLVVAPLPSNTPVPKEVFNHNNQQTWVYSNSWGMTDNGYGMTPISLGQQLSLYDATHNGRNGHGSVHVWAAGNGGVLDDCAMDLSASNVRTISVTGTTRVQQRATGEYTPTYAENCASVIGAMTLPSGTIKVGTECIRVPGGSSSAAAQYTGLVVALLQINPQLTPRDIQALTIESAKFPGNFRGTIYKNGAGHQFHKQMGFGIIDQDLAMVRAKTIQRLTPERQCHLAQHVTACNLTAVEWAEATLYITTDNLGLEELTLSSPSGTVVTMLSSRPGDHQRGILSLKLWSNKFWGESPSNGTRVWLPRCRKCTLHSWTLTLYGTGGIPGL
nr:subtilisin-like proprotein convertase [Salmonid herpesvirus 1]